MLYRLISGRDHACVEAVKRLAADVISNSNNSSSNYGTHLSFDSLHIITELSYHTNDGANTDSDSDSNILKRLFLSSTSAENTTTTGTSNTTTTTSVLRAAISKRLIDDVAFVKRIGRVPESQNLDIKALFKSGRNIYVYILIYLYLHVPYCSYIL